MIYQTSLYLDDRGESDFISAAATTCHVVFPRSDGGLENFELDLQKELRFGAKMSAHGESAYTAIVALALLLMCHCHKTFLVLLASIFLAEKI